MTDVLEKIQVSAAEAERVQLANSINLEPFPSDQPLYCSYSKINGKPKREIVTQEQLFTSEESVFVMNPLIFYRVKDPQSVDPTKLPLINLAKFYARSGADEEQIKFTVKKISMVTSSNKDFSEMLSNEELKESFT